MYVYMKCFLTNDFMRSASLDLVHRQVGLGGATKGVCEHIMKMRDITAQLKTLEVDMSDTFLVHYILNTLP